MLSRVVADLSNPDGPTQRVVGVAARTGPILLATQTDRQSRDYPRGTSATGTYEAQPTCIIPANNNLAGTYEAQPTCSVSARN